MTLYEKNLLRNRINETLKNLESHCKIQLCTEEGINLGREYATKNFKDVDEHSYINKATICYAEALISLNIFYNWWSENISTDNYPLLDGSLIERVKAICIKCSPKSGASTGAGAGAIGGFLFGGVIGALIGGVVGAYGGSKLTEEASGERYYAILREAISEIYAYLLNEISKQLEYALI